MSGVAFGPLFQRTGRLAPFSWGPRLPPKFRGVLLSSRSQSPLVAPSLRRFSTSSCTPNSAPEPIWGPLGSEQFIASLRRSQDADDYSHQLLSAHQLEEYRLLSTQSKALTLRHIASELGISQDQAFAPLPQASDRESDPSTLPRLQLAQFRKLKKQLTPLYEALFRHLINLPNGLKFILDLRADLLAITRSPDPGSLSSLDLAQLRFLDSELKSMLGNWFHVGLLELRRVRWTDSAELLEKIAEYEAVHPIFNVSDLKQRVGGGRRLFAFFHPVMPQEPVVMVNVAFGSHGIIQNINEILRVPPREAQAAEEELKASPEAQGTAMFYSITSPHKGLSGVQLGNVLIKCVVQELQKELPNVTTFSTLSPIPGFRPWLEQRLLQFDRMSSSGIEVPVKILSRPSLASAAEAFAEGLRSEMPEVIRALGDSAATEAYLLWFLQTHNSSKSWLSLGRLSGGLQAAIESLFMQLCAQYICLEKRQGKAVDPVAKLVVLSKPNEPHFLSPRFLSPASFHLRNGAMVHSLNWMGNLSSKGMSESCGISANYLYDVPQTERRTLSYISPEAKFEWSDFVEEMIPK